MSLFIQIVQFCSSKFTFTLFFYCSFENDDVQDTSGDENKTDKERPIEYWGKPCKANLAIIAELKEEVSPIHQFISTGKRQLFIPLLDYKMPTIFIQTQ